MADELKQANAAASKMVKSINTQFKTLGQAQKFLTESSKNQIGMIQRQIQVATVWQKKMANFGQYQHVVKLQDTVVRKQQELATAYAKQVPLLTRFQTALSKGIPQIQVGQKAVGMLAPTFAKLAAKGKLAGMAMLGFSAAQFGLGMLIQALFSAVSGVSKTFGTLTGTVGIANTTLQQSAALYTSSRLAGTLLGANQQDVIDGTNALANAYAINHETMRRFEGSSMRAVGVSIGGFIGLAKYMGFTGKQAGILGADLVRMGANITQLPNEVGRFQAAMKESGLTAMDMSQAIAHIAPVSMLATNSMDKLYGALSLMRKGMDETTDPLLKAAGADRAFRLMTDSMMSFTKAASTLTLPELMVFGGGRAPGTDPLEAIKQGIQKGPIVNTLEYVKTLMSGANNAQDGIFTGIALLNQRFALSAEQSYAMIPMLEKIYNSSLEAEAGNIDAQKQLQTQMTKTAAMLSGATADPLDRIRGLIEGIFGVIVDIRGIFKGGSGLMPRIAKTMVGW